MEFSQGSCSRETGSAKAAVFFRGIEEIVSSQVEIAFLSAERTLFFSLFSKRMKVSLEILYIFHVL
jgi:hypothetical protein